MKIFISLAVLCCLIFCFCACGNQIETEKETQESVVATETVTEKATEAETVAENDAKTTITEDEAIKLVEDKYSFGEDYGYKVRRIEEVNGVSYYGVDLRRLVGGVSTYQTTYFVTTDGSDIIEGYYENDKPVLVGPKNEITEDEAIEMVKNKYNFPEEEGYGYNVRGVEEIDGYVYYGVDLRKSVNGTSTYQTTYFVAVNGSEIVEGYYENDKPVIVD